MVLNRCKMAYSSSSTNHQAVGRRRNQRGIAGVQAFVDEQDHGGKGPAGFSLLMESADFPEQSPIDIMVAVVLNFKEYVGSALAVTFEIAVESFFRAFEGVQSVFSVVRPEAKGFWQLSV